MLGSTLALTPSEWSFPYAFDCANYGQWKDTGILQRSQTSGHPANLTAFWMQQRRCHGNLSPPECYHPDFEPCLSPAAEGFPRCKYVCYTLSVASTLHTFLASNHTRMLLLEDDVCLTSALADSRPLLLQLSSSTRWSIAKLGGCHPCDLAGDFETLVGGYATCWANANRRPPMDVELDVPNELKGSLGKSFCAHALGFTRLGAKNMLRLAFPVSTVFDDILMLLGGGFGHEALQSTLKFMSLSSERQLGAVHARHSLFSQWSRQQSYEKPTAGFDQVGCAQSPCVKSVATLDKGRMPGVWKRFWSCGDNDG